MSDKEILDWMESHRAEVKAYGKWAAIADLDEDDETNWEVTPGTLNPAIAGEGSTLRNAVIDAAKVNL